METMADVFLNDILDFALLCRAKQANLFFRSGKTWLWKTKSTDRKSRRRTEVLSSCCGDASPSDTLITPSWAKNLAGIMPVTPSICGCWIR